MPGSHQRAERYGRFAGPNVPGGRTAASEAVLLLDSRLDIRGANPAGQALLDELRDVNPEGGLIGSLEADPAGRSALDRIRSMVETGRDGEVPLGGLGLGLDRFQARIASAARPKGRPALWLLTLRPMRGQEASTAAGAPGPLLDRLAGLAVSGPDLPSIAGEILDLLVAGLGGDVGLLRLGRPGDRAEDYSSDPGASLAWSHQLARSVEESGFPLVVADLETDGRVAEGGELLAQGLRSYLCQPLLASGRVLGTLHIASREPEHFDSASVQTAASAAHLVSLAADAHLYRQQMEQRVDERAREVTLLLEMSRSLGHVTSRNEVPDLLLEHLPRLADPDVGTVLLADGDAAWDLTLREYEPVCTELRRAARAAAPAALGRSAGARPEKVHVREFRSGSGSMEGPAPPSWRSELHEPLRRRGEPAGVVSLFASRPCAFGEPQRRMLTTIAAQVSLTLDRLETVQEMERSRLESVVDSMGEGLLWVNAAGRLQLVNPTARRLVRDLTGDPHPPDLDRLGEVDLGRVGEDLAAGRTPRYQADVELHGGRRRFSLTASPVRCRSGAADGMVIVLSDVTKQRLLQQKLLQSEKLSALGEMISGVAHELNNPLAAVMGYAQLLESGLQDDAAQQRKIQAINREALRCQRIVQSLLSFARDHHPEKAPVDINGVIRSVMQLLEYQLRVDGVEMELRLSADLPAVLGDAHQLQQVVLNLVNNAHHAMQDRAGPGRLRIVSSLRGERVLVLVEDNGVGIPNDQLGRVFDPFFSTKEVGKGTGLGLSLTYGCVTEHGGDLRVESQPGEWTRFTIELPAAFGRAPAGPEEAPRSVPRRRVPSAARDILVVDDEPAVAEVIAEALSACGHRVRVVHDGGEACRHLTGEPVDLIISDLKMPQMNGRELYDEVRRRSPGLASRIIFSTGDTVSRETRDFLQRTGSHYLTKPFTIAELQDLVERILERSG